MEYRLLGRSGLKVSVITMGTMTFGRAKDGVLGSVDTAEAKRQIDQCIDAGVNLIDTADVYAHGASEEIVGEALGKKRPDVLIATKVRFPMGKGPNDQGLSRHYIIAECERSLKRLGTDWIDLYQVHQWDGQTPLEETMEALDRLIQQGKVRYIGCSNYSGWHIMKAMGVARADGRQPFVSQQIHYTLQAREAEYELVPVSIDQGLGILAFSPLHGGFLSGKYRRGQPWPQGTRFDNPQNTEPWPVELEKLYATIDLLDEVARAHNVTVSQAALNYLLRKPAVNSLIVGLRTATQLEENLQATDWLMTAEEVCRLDKMTEPKRRYPYYIYDPAVDFSPKT